VPEKVNDSRRDGVFWRHRRRELPSLDAIVLQSGTMPESGELNRLLARARGDARILAVISFGSTVRGEITEQSDVDVCLVPWPGPPNRRSLTELRIEYTSEFDLDVQVFPLLPLFVRSRVLREEACSSPAMTTPCTSSPLAPCARSKPSSHLPCLPLRGAACWIVSVFWQSWTSWRDTCANWRPSPRAISPSIGALRRNALANVWYRLQWSRSSISASCSSPDSASACRVKKTTCFKKLEQAGVLSPETVRIVKRMKGCRNILVHEYGGVDDELIFDVVRSRRGDFTASRARSGRRLPATEKPVEDQLHSLV